MDLPTECILNAKALKNVFFLFFFCFFLFFCSFKIIWFLGPKALESIDQFWMIFSRRFNWIWSIFLFFFQKKTHSIHQNHLKYFQAISQWNSERSQNSNSLKLARANWSWNWSICLRPSWDFGTGIMHEDASTVDKRQNGIDMPNMHRWMGAGVLHPSVVH